MAGRQWHREVFLAHSGAGPYPCYGCKKPVTFEELEVHHLDETPSNNIISNLVAVHHACHTRITRTGHVTSPEVRAKISAGRTGVKMPPRTAEHRAKLAEAQRRRWARARGELV